MCDDVHELDPSVCLRPRVRGCMCMCVCGCAGPCVCIYMCLDGLVSEGDGEATGCIYVNLMQSLCKLYLF